MVDPKGNPLGPDGVEGAGIVPWFDNKDGIFPQLPRDTFLVLDVRSPGDKDWYDPKSDTNRVLQIESGGGWCARNETAVPAALREFGEETGYPLFQMDNGLLTRMSSIFGWQPITKRLIATFLLQLTPVQAERLQDASNFVKDWPYDELRHFENLNRGVVLYTDKKRANKTDAGFNIETTEDIGARRAIQTMVAVSLSELKKVFACFEERLPKDLEKWVAKMLSEVRKSLPDLKDQPTTQNDLLALLQQLITTKNDGALKTELQRIEGLVKRGYNPSDTAKNIMNDERGKVTAYFFGDSSLYVEDKSVHNTNEKGEYVPTKKFVEHKAFSSIEIGIRGFFLIVLKGVWDKVLAATSNPSSL